MCPKRVLTGNAGRNDNDVGALQGLLQALAVLWEVAVDGGNGRDVGQVGGYTEGVDDIVKGQVVDQRRGLEEKRQRLSDSTGCSCDDCRSEVELASMSNAKTL